jgi:hypothetical protein
VVETSLMTHGLSKKYDVLRGSSILNMAVNSGNSVVLNPMFSIGGILILHHDLFTSVLHLVRFPLLSITRLLCLPSSFRRCQSLRNIRLLDSLVLRIRSSSSPSRNCLLLTSTNAVPFDGCTNTMLCKKPLQSLTAVDRLVSKGSRGIQVEDLRCFSVLHPNVSRKVIKIDLAADVGDGGVQQFLLMV